MPAWTEEASFPPEAQGVSIAGVPWVTVGLLLSCLGVLAAAGGLRSGVALPALLTWGAKATSLILDRGETWRLFAANLLHKDPLHLAFNAFALWNVGGALERAVRPADYLALLVFTALGTTLASAAGADSISLGASGMAFGLLGASASFGWRRGVRGPLRSFFGLRVVPWLLALFAAGLGSHGVDNWGHAGGLLAGVVMGCFLTPRGWAGEGAARRLAMATGAVLGTVSLGLVAAPMLPALGPVGEGPAGLEARVPLGWRRVSSAPDRVSYSNGLSGGFRSSATLVQPAPCRGRSCSCEQVVRAAMEDDLWRLADVGALGKLELAGSGSHIDGLVAGDEGRAQISAVCVDRPAAVVVLQPAGSSGSLAERMAATLRWPGKSLHAAAAR
jgi:rhomboid protease GluP